MQQSCNTWDQQPGEPDRDYARFKAYLAAGPGRKLDGMGADFGVKDQYVRRLAMRYQWTRRAAAFDEHEADRALGDFAAVRDRLLRKQIEAAEIALNNLVDGMEAINATDPGEARALASTVKTLLEPIIATKDGENAAEAMAAAWAVHIHEVGTDDDRKHRLLREAGVGDSEDDPAAGDTGSGGGAPE